MKKSDELHAQLLFLGGRFRPPLIKFLGSVAAGVVFGFVIDTLCGRTEDGSEPPKNRQNDCILSDEGLYKAIGIGRAEQRVVRDRFRQTTFVTVTRLKGRPAKTQFLVNWKVANQELAKFFKIHPGEEG